MYDGIARLQVKDKAFDTVSLLEWTMPGVET